MAVRGKLFCEHYSRRDGKFQWEGRPWHWEGERSVPVRGNVRVDRAGMKSQRNIEATGAEAAGWIIFSSCVMGIWDLGRPGERASGRLCGEDGNHYGDEEEQEESRKESKHESN